MKWNETSIAHSSIIKYGWMVKSYKFSDCSSVTQENINKKEMKCGWKREKRKEIELSLAIQQCDKLEWAGRQ